MVQAIVPSSLVGTITKSSRNVSQHGPMGCPFLNCDNATEDEDFGEVWGRVLNGQSWTNCLFYPDFQERLNVVYYFKDLILLNNKTKTTYKQFSKSQTCQTTEQLFMETQVTNPRSAWNSLRILHPTCPGVFGKSLESTWNTPPFLPDVTWRQE